MKLEDDKVIHLFLYLIFNLKGQPNMKYVLSIEWCIVLLGY